LVCFSLSRYKNIQLHDWKKPELINYFPNKLL